MNDLNFKVRGRVVEITGLKLNFIDRLKLILLPWAEIQFNQTIQGRVFHNGKDITKYIFVGEGVA